MAVANIIYIMNIEQLHVAAFNETAHLDPFIFEDWLSGFFSVVVVVVYCLFRFYVI